MQTLADPVSLNRLEPGQRAPKVLYRRVFELTSNFRDNTVNLVLRPPRQQTTAGARGARSICLVELRRRVVLYMSLTDLH
mmetsp:Transcript_16511/g.46990  ORF Transcript_16511/g.46990 Transcript_16511/m.46990 type:complete len:80 (-) Transcript_16511:3878-4117(-)